MSAVINLSTVKYKRALASFIAILIVFSAVVDLLVVSHQRDLILDEEYGNAGLELALITSFVREAILRTEYSRVEQFMVNWGKENMKIVELKAVAPNDFVLAHYRRSEPSGFSLHLQETVRYEGRDLITIELVKDLTSVEMSLNKLTWQLVSASVMLVLILGIVLWYTLKRLALVPLEKEIERRRQTEEKFRKLMESAPDAMIFADSEGRIVMVNGQAEKLFKYTREEMLGEELEMLVPERVREEHRKKRADYFIKPETRPMGAGLDLYGIASDGKEFPVDISLSPIATEEGVFVLADIRDITEHKLADEKIRRSYYFESTISTILQISLEPIPLDEQLQRILEAALAVPWLRSLSMGSIYLVDDDPEKLVMKAQKGIPGEMLEKCTKVAIGDCLCGLGASQRKVIFADCIDERHTACYKDMLPHGHYCVPILAGEKVLGVLNLYLSDTHKTDPEEEALLYSISNTIAGILERRQTELEKQRLQEQLVQTEKLSALGRITANVAHEIRNPLTSIGGFARRLYKRVSEEKQEKTYAGVIVTEVDRLEKILRNVLTYSREQMLCIEPNDINAIINESLLTFEVLCSEQRVNITKSFADLLPIMVDKDQVHEALNNLISNAVDAMPDGGMLTIVTCEEIIEGRRYAAVKVTDTGFGITKGQINMIFEPFYSTKLLRHGTGLGLPICKKIVEAHGGFIRGESVIDEGTTFSLYFPLDNLGSR